MPIVWKKISIPIGTAEDHPQQTLVRCELPILEQVLISLPNLPAVGVRLVTAKQQIFPSSKFGGDPFVYGSPLPIIYHEDVRLDGKPYDVIIETINGDAAIQICQVGLALSDDARSETDLLQAILEELQIESVRAT
jgi:hypothetical protein